MHLIKEILFTRWPMRLAIVFTSFFAAIFGLLAPFFQKEFVDIMMMGQSQFPLFVNSHPIWLLVISFIFFLGSVALNQWTNYIGLQEAVQMQSILAQRLYQHNLNLRNDSLNRKTVGEIVSIYTTDVPGSTILLEQTLPQGTTTFFPLILTPIFLSYLYQIPMLWSYLVLLSTVILSTYMAYRQSRFFFRFKSLAADRIGLVNEWVQNIRNLRILAWVRSFEQKIFQVRAVETQNRVNMVTNGQMMNAISSTMTYILTVMAIITYTHLNPPEKISGGHIMALLWIIGIFLNRAFRQMPWFFTFAFDAWTSIKRIDSFMQLKNTEPHPRHLKLPEAIPHPLNISIKDLNLSIGYKNILKNINLNIKEGEFVAFVGEVGSGKSMLLLSLIGETGATFDEYKMGTLDAKHLELPGLRKLYSYIPQEGFIISSSLRDNVYFEYDATLLQDTDIIESLQESQLNILQEPIINSLELEIGERGVNLSGGQKQRVSLARTSYHLNPVVLIDDSLSAVDVDTEEKLLNNLIKGAWKNHTRIMCTHRLTVLEHADRIYFLKEGRICDSGNLRELQNRSKEFSEFTKTLIQPATEAVLV